MVGALEEASVVPLACEALKDGKTVGDDTRTKVEGVNVITVGISVGTMGDIGALDGA